jgi:outer membrane protein TolC
LAALPSGGARVEVRRALAQALLKGVHDVDTRCFITHRRHHPLSLAMAAAWAAVAIPAASSQGAESGHSTLRLSLEDAVGRAQREAPEALIAEAQVGEAAATRVGAGLRLPSNPRLNLDGRLGLFAGESGALGFASSVEALFEVSDAPGARLREAERRIEAARAQGDVARLEARVEAASAYVGAQLAGLRIEQARQGLALAERLVSAAAERGRAGAGTDIEITSAEIERAERRAEVHAGEAERLRHETDLRRLLGVEPEATLELTSAVAEPSVLPALPALLAAARGHFPELSASDARLTVLQAEEARLAVEAWPKVGALAGIDASPASPKFGLLGMSVELPFFQRNQRPRAMVRAQRRTETTRRSALERQVRLALSGAAAVHAAHLAELEALRAQGLPAASRRVALVEQGWRAGRFDVFRVTAAAQDLVRLQAKHAEVLGRIWQARLLIEQLTGGLQHVNN